VSRGFLGDSTEALYVLEDAYEGGQVHHYHCVPYGRLAAFGDDYTEGLTGIVRLLVCLSDEVRPRWAGMVLTLDSK